MLSRKPKRIDGELLRQFPEFREFQTPKPKPPSAKDGLAPTLQDARTPEEEIEAAYQKLRDTLANELLETVKGCSPSFFERLVVDLLVKMGYGGTRRDAGEAIGKSGDGGIDGIIKEDRLGLDVVYIQAKRWNASIGRPEVQSFAGALQGQKARKGVFITTSSFTEGARQFASGIDTKIILIDGEQLAQLMIDFGVGVATVAQYEMKRVDGDYFDSTQ